jgi:surface protein
MSIKKLRPRRRDVDINQDSDLTLAKFGNVNAVIDQANGIIDEINNELSLLEESIIQFDKDPFITVWKTDNTSSVEATADNQIKLPLIETGTYNFVVEWGDGKRSTITSYDDPEVTHTYRTAGTYTVTIKGLLRGWSFLYNNDRNEGGTDRLKLLEIQQWGCLQITGGGNFKGCQNLSLVNTTDTPDFSQTTSLGAMFEDCSGLTTINNVENWDVSHIEYFNGMFEGQYFGRIYLTGDFSSWDVSSAKSFFVMFRNTDVNFNASNWDVSNVTSFQAMFSGCRYFNNGGDPGINNWDVSSARSLDSVFRETPFNQPIGDWDVRNVTTLRSMFRSCPFNQDISNWQLDSWNYSPDTFLSSAFNGDISSWNFTQVNRMSRFLNPNAFSTANYDAMLLALAASPTLVSNVLLSTGPQYTTDGTGDITTDPAAAREYIINTYNWSISDRGLQA